MGIYLTPLIAKINLYTNRRAHRKIYVVQKQNCLKLLNVVLVSMHAFGTIGCFLKQTTMCFFYDFVYLLLKLVLILPAVTAISVESVFSTLSLVKTS